MTSGRRAGPVAGEGGALRARASSTPPSPAPPARDASVIWHELECGAYEADLGLWEELAERVDEPILDLGCGTGRVAVHLARRGHEVAGIDCEPAFVAALERRAEGLPAGAAVGDARDFDGGRRFGLVLAPMQLIQLFDDPGDRIRCMSCVAAHLGADRLAAFAIVETVPEPIDASPPLPDACEVDGWVFSSLPLDSPVDTERIRLRRLRQTVSPDGGLCEEVDETVLRRLGAAELEAEAVVAGMQPAGRRPVAATAEHVGSTVVLLGGGG